MNTNDTVIDDIKMAIESVFKVHHCNDRLKKIELFTEIYSDYINRKSSHSPINDPYGYTIWRANNYFKVELQEEVLEIANNIFKEGN